MYCKHCGGMLSDAASFCTKCGNPVIPSDDSTKSKSLTIDLGVSNTFAVAEGIGGCIALLLIAVAPIIELDLLLDTKLCSMAQLWGLVSEYGDYLGDAGSVIGVFMACAVAGTAAASALAVKGLSSIGSSKVPRNPSRAIVWIMPVCTVVMWALLCLVGEESYGTISPTGWIWAIFVLGIVLGVLDVKAWGKNGSSR